MLIRSDIRTCSMFLVVFAGEESLYPYWQMLYVKFVPAFIGPSSDLKLIEVSSFALVTELVRMVMSGWRFQKHTSSFNFIPEYFCIVCLVLSCPSIHPCHPTSNKSVFSFFFLDIFILFQKCLFCLMWRNPFHLIFQTFFSLAGTMGSKVPSMISPVPSLLIILSVLL